MCVRYYETENINSKVSVTIFEYTSFLKRNSRLLSKEDRIFAPFFR